MAWLFGAIALLSTLIGVGMFLTSWYRRAGNSSEKKKKIQEETHFDEEHLEYLELGEVNKHPPHV
jgi:hypothetical protein